MGSKAKAKGRSRGWTALVVVMLILAAGAIFGGRYALGLLYVPETEVPNLVGLSVYDAETQLRQRGLTLEVVGEGEFSSSIPVNHVLWQDHNPDLPVREGRVIKVRVSLGARQINVPPLTGLRRIDAEDSLRKAGLKLGEVTERYSSDQGEGWVLQQVPEARMVAEEGTMVDLVISKGPLLVPLLFGKTLEEAEEVLDELELTLGEVTEIYSDDPDGTVVLQSPHPPSEVRPGQRINLVLSKGTAPPPRETLLMIHVPAGRGMVTVQLVLIDGSESQVLHEARHDSGTSFPLSVKYRSDGARVQMFINGQLHDEIALS